MNKLKKFVAVLLSATILMSMTTLAVAANETSSEPTAEITTDNYSISTDNSMGELIADALEGSEENLDPSSSDGYTSCINDIEVNGSTVAVEYHATQDCTMLVALYDENTNKMLASGKSTATAESTLVNVTIETEQMPQAYVLKAFMLDEHNAPIADAHTDIMHTTPMLELLEMTVSDFEEEQILNLDENENTNFAVYSEGVKKFSMTDTQNILKSYDKTNGVYVFENASNELLNLNVGDFIACDDDANNIIIIKVKSFTVDGTTVTIAEDETSLDEVFNYVKIESKQSMEDAIVENGTAEETASTYASKVPQSVGASFDKDAYNLVFGDSKDRYEYSGGIALDLDLECDLYLSFSTLEIELKFTVSYGAVFECEGELPEEQLADLSKKLSIKFSPVTGINIDCTPEIIVKFSGSAKAEFTATGEIGFEAGISDDGTFFNKTKDFSVKPSVSIEAEIFIGLDLGPDVEVIHEKIAEIDLEAIAGVTITGTVKLEGEDLVDKQEESMHMCDLCIEGEINVGLTLEAAITFLDENYEFEPALNISIYKKDFYYSADMKDLGFGECPYKKYLVTVTVKDTDNKPISGANVTYSTDAKSNVYFGTTDVNGEVKAYLDGHHLDESGEPAKTWYLFSAEKDGEKYLAPIYLYPNDVKELTITFGKKTTELKITVLDKASKPIEGAEVSVSYASHTMNAQGVTDKEGLCVLTVETYDTYDITVMSGSLYDSRTINIETDGRFPIFRLFEEEEPTEPITTTTPPTIPTEPTSPNMPTTPSTPNQPTTVPETEPITTPVNIIDSGQCGENAFWSLDKNYCLTISGSGEMYDMVDSSSSPWDDYRREITKLVIEEGITSIGKKAFWGYDMSSITFPSSLKFIDDDAFWCCNNLESITIPKNLEGIGVSSFAGCQKLESIEFSEPSSLKYIGKEAFESCYSLRRVEFPSSLTSIGSSAFVGCNGLREIIIPPSVTSIGSSAFNTFANFEIFFYGNFPGINDVIFFSSEVTAYYPAGNPTWTEDRLLNYGGKVTWIPISVASANYKTSVSCAFPLAYSASDCEVVSENNDVSFDNLCRNTGYVIAVVKSSTVDDILSADNLLYFNQYKSDENGCLSVNNLPVDENEDFEVLIFGRIKGDVNGDNDFDVNDVTYTQMHLAQYKKEDGCEMIDTANYEAFNQADFNGDGLIDVSDVTHMQLTLAGIV